MRGQDGTPDRGEDSHGKWGGGVKRGIWYQITVFRGEHQCFSGFYLLRHLLGSHAKTLKNNHPHTVLKAFQGYVFYIAI